MNLPKVLIGCPTAAPYAYCLAAWSARVKALSYKKYKIVLIDNSPDERFCAHIERQGIQAIHYPRYVADVRERIAASRNMLREMVLKENYDYLLSLEQDVIPPIDVIERLLSHQEKIVSGVYFNPFQITIRDKQGKVLAVKEKLMPALYLQHPTDPEAKIPCAEEEVVGDCFFPVRFCGLGCVLIHRSVLEKISFRSDTTKPLHDDSWFNEDVKKHQFTIYVDTSVKCKHLLSGKPRGLFDDLKRT